MNIVVAGGTGFLGRPLAACLVQKGHDVIVLTRRPAPPGGGVRYVTWNPDGTARSKDSPAAPAGSEEQADGWTLALDGADAVINLAGDSIADGRWTAERKETLRQSRISSTRSLVAAIRLAAHKPSVFLNGSAVGYYGITADPALDESFPPGSDFLATLCVDWEAETHAASALGCRVVIIRAGVVLARDGGALRKLIPPFQFFVGGPIASGNQVMSWIHRDDWIALVVWALEQRNVSGVLNGTAPQPVTNREFSSALGRALHRPSWLPVPRLALRIALGEMADIALVGGQRVVPKRAQELGFTFQYPEVAAAMTAAVR
jgi:uncharacterized protein (TIGR01777 family)